MRHQKYVPVMAAFLLPFCLIIPGPAHAQTVSDSGARVDTSIAPRTAGDSLATKQLDSAGATRTDTGAARPDTGSRAQRPAAPAPPTPPPVDSAFVAACNPPPPGVPAASLLLVTFSPTLTERERREIAKRVGGTFAGVASSGEQYIRVSGSTRAAADSLIWYQGVSQVSERPCSAALPSGH
jgi:hypothetical protein